MAPTGVLQRYFADYSAYHRTSGNKLCHYVGIPLITITLLGLLSRLGRGSEADFFRLDGGTILLMAAALWYLYLDWRIGLPFTVFSYGLYFIGRAIPVPALWAFFVLGWIVQFVGHYLYEKKSPAFFKNFEHLLVGPLWIFSKLVAR